MAVGDERAPTEGAPALSADSSLRTRLRRPVLTAHRGFTSTLQLQIDRLQPPQVALIDPSSLHELGSMRAAWEDVGVCNCSVLVKPRGR